MFLEKYLPQVVDSGHLSLEDHTAFTEMWLSHEELHLLSYLGLQWSVLLARNCQS